MIAEMIDDIRFILMDRLIRLDAGLRAAGKIWGEMNPPFIEVTAEEEALLAATAHENGHPIAPPLKFFGVNVRPSPR